MSQRPHRNRPVVGGDPSEFRAAHQRDACPQVCGADGGEHSRGSGPNHEDVCHAPNYAPGTLAVDTSADAGAGASTSHRINFRSSTKMENNTGTSSSVTNVASVSPPICA